MGCWDGTLSQYDLDGKQIGKPTDLGFMPCCVSYMPKGDMLHGSVCVRVGMHVVLHTAGRSLTCAYPAQHLLTILLMLLELLHCGAQYVKDIDQSLQ